MKLTAKVIGAKELSQAFERLSRQARGRLLEQALLSGGLLIANDAKRRAPYRTGNLRRSIHVGGFGAQGGLEGTTTGTDIGGRRSTPTSAEVLVGTNVEYARRLELGFTGTDSRGRRYHQPARPYLRSALDSQRQNVVREVGQALRDLLGIKR